MYMAINESLKTVEQAIKYKFKSPRKLWGALQHYNVTGPEFYPYSTRPGGNASLAQVGASVLQLAMIMKGYSNMAPPGNTASSLSSLWSFRYYYTTQG
jgi:hypothetical protein